MVRRSTNSLLLGDMAATVLAQLAFAPLTLARAFLEGLAQECPIAKYPRHLFALDGLPQCKLGSRRGGCRRCVLPGGGERRFRRRWRQPVCISRQVDFFNDDA